MQIRHFHKSHITVRFQFLCFEASAFVVTSLKNSDTLVANRSCLFVSMHAILLQCYALDCRKKKDGKTEDQPDEVEANGDTDDVNVSRTLTYDVQGEEQKEKGEEVKLVWKNSTGQPGAAKAIKSLASKAFFTPTTKEDQANDAEQVLYIYFYLTCNGGI